MEWSKLVPKGFHFIRTKTHDGVTHDAFEWNDRWSVRPNKYYFIDFNLSNVYPIRAGKEPTETQNIRIGQDRTVPEFAHGGPYDPFKLDIYQLGNAMRQVIEVRVTPIYRDNCTHTTYRNTRALNRFLR
jgi:hypothetical protein